MPERHRTARNWLHTVWLAFTESILHPRSTTVLTPEARQCPTWLPNDQWPPVPHAERERCVVPLPHGPDDHRTARELERGL